MSGRWAIGGVVVVLALGVFLLLRDDGEGRGDSSGGPAAIAPEEARPVPLVPASSPARAETPAASERESLAAAPRPAEVRAAASVRPAVQTVRVVHHRGDPASGVRVVLASRHGGGGGGTHVTDSEGLAAFRTRLDEVTVSVPGSFATPVERSLAVAEWPAEPLELVLPPTGTLVVEARGADGAPLREEETWWVHLEPVRARVPGVERFLFDDESRAVHGGEVRFENVETGQALAVVLDGAYSKVSVREEVQGPVVDGEEVRVRLEIPRTPTVAMRVLEAPGDPLRQGFVVATLTRTSEGASAAGTEYLRTGTDGRLSFSPSMSWQEGTTLTLVLSHDQGRLASAELDLSRPLRNGETYLGDVLLHPAPMLVAGRVVDEEGNGVGARLGIVTDPLSRAQRHVEVEEDGTFAAFGEPLRDAHFLRVLAAGFQTPDPIPFDPGVRDLEIVLNRGATVHGSVVVPPGFPAEGVLVFAEGVPGLTLPRRNGRFQLDGIPPGTADWHVKLFMGEQRLVTIPGVRVTGPECAPAALQEIDLTALVHVVTITVWLPDGAPASSGWVSVLGERSPVRTAFVVEGGRAELLVPTGPVDLEVRVPGYRTERLTAVDSDREVRLAGAIPVTLRLPDDVPLPREGRLQCRLRRSGEAPLHPLYVFRGVDVVGGLHTDAAMEPQEFDEGRTIRASVPEAGSYVVEFGVLPDGARPDASMPAGAGEPRLLELDERSAGLTFEVRPDPALYPGHATGR